VILLSIQACGNAVPVVCTNLSEWMTLRNRLSWPNDRAILFRSGRLGLATQVEVEAENAVLRHQSIELSLRLHGRVRLSDRSQVILGSLTSAF